MWFLRHASTNLKIQESLKAQRNILFPLFCLMNRFKLRGTAETQMRGKLSFVLLKYVLIFKWTQRAQCIGYITHTNLPISSL